MKLLLVFASLSLAQNTPEACLNCTAIYTVDGDIGQIVLGTMECFEGQFET